MRAIGLIGAAVGLLVAIGAGIAVLLAPTAMTLVVLLLGLVLFFTAVAAARRNERPLQVAAEVAPPATLPPTKREPDAVKLRRLAKKLGVEEHAAVPKPVALNEEAARDALRDILGKRGAQK